MNIETGWLKTTEKYFFGINDKIEIKSQYGVTEIYINGKQLQFLNKITLIVKNEKVPKLIIERFVTDTELKNR